jgi:hypothetical protein
MLTNESLAKLRMTYFNCKSPCLYTVVIAELNLPNPDRRAWNAIRDDKGKMSLSIESRPTVQKDELGIRSKESSIKFIAETKSSFPKENGNYENSRQN